MRKLQPDDALLRRRAAGEPLRDLARDYGVRHTTLSRYFRRPEVVKQLKRADQLNRAERRAAEARWRAEEKAERKARRKAKQQKAEEARVAAVASRGTLDAARPAGRQPRGGLAETDSGASDFGTHPESGVAVTGSRRGRRAGGRVLPATRSAYAQWLDERDARVRPTRADRYSRNDDAAARVVAGGGGMQAVIETTGLRTRENVLRLIDPAILEEARQNDAAPAAAESAD